MKRTMMTALAAVCVVAMLPAMSGAVVVFSDDFNTLSGISTSGVITNDWYGQGNEEKTYNTSDNSFNDFPGVLGWAHTTGTFFDQVAHSFSGVTLANVGDFITLSLDYEMQGGLTSSAGLRVRLYKWDEVSLFNNVITGYGLNVATGTSTNGATYRSLLAQAPFGNGTAAGQAVYAAFGNAGTISLTATKTGAAEITLDGSFSGATNVVFSSLIPANANFTFDALGVSVGSTAHGVAIDNVAVTTNVIPEPATLGLMGFAGLMAFAFRRRMK